MAKPATGYAAAGIVVLIWAGWLVVSRSGAQSALTIFDLAALRYGVSAVIALPFVIYFKPWRSMTVTRMAALTILLGPVYILFVFAGFIYAPAAHGGIFMNGALPAITLFIGWMWMAEKVSVRQLVGVVMIIGGALLVVADASQLSLGQSWVGDLMFLVGAVFFSCYLVVSRLWQIKASQILLCGSLLNAAIYLPIWLIFLPSGFGAASDSQLLMQTLYQGLVPNLLGLLLVGLAVKHIGSASTAAFMAAVPGMGTILSLVFLAEVPGQLGWLGLGVLTPGIVMVVLTRHEKRQLSPSIAR